MHFPSDFVSTIQFNPVRVSTSHLHLRPNGRSILVITRSDRNLLEVYDNEYMQTPTTMSSEQLQDYLARETTRKLAKVSQIRLN